MDTTTGASGHGARTGSGQGTGAGSDSRGDGRRPRDADEPTLGAELRSSALLLGMAVAVTMGVTALVLALLGVAS